MPTLVCSKAPAGEDVGYYTLEGFDTGEYSEIPLSSDPLYGFEYDLSALAPGSYEVRAHACNSWGCSLASSPLSFIVPEKLSIPVNLNIISG